MGAGSDVSCELNEVSSQPAENYLKLRMGCTRYKQKSNSVNKNLAVASADPIF